VDREIKHTLYHFLLLPLVAIAPPGIRRILIRGIIFRFNLKFDYVPKKAIVLENMRKAYPDDPELERKAEENLIYSILQDSAVYKFRFPVLCGRRQRIRMEGRGILERALLENKGVLLMTGHTGAFVSSVWGHGFHGIRASLLTNDAPASAEFSKAYRLFARLVIGTIEKSCRKKVVTFPLGGEKTKAAGAARRIKSLLLANEPVISALDIPPNLTSSREKVWFLDRECLMPSGIVRIARKTGAPVVIYDATWDRLYSHDCTIKFIEAFPLDSSLEDDLQNCSRAVEAIIRRNPSQWAHWEAFQLFIINNRNGEATP